MSVERRKITRNRETLACTECSRRKLRCNRGQPCSTCIKGGTQAACRYQKSATGQPVNREQHIQAEARLEHLETLVQELSQANGSTQEPLPRIPSQPVSASNGIAKNSDHAYTGSTHWSDGLKDIGYLRGVLSDHHLSEPQGEISGTDVIFGIVPAIGYDQVLLGFLPSKQETDRLTTAYFRARALVAPFLHSGQFMRRYHRFWERPSQAPPLWTSMLFSVCHVAASRIVPQNDDQNRANGLAIAAAYCLIAGRYNRPQRFTVESLLLYLQSQCITTIEVPGDIGTLFGSLIRLATKMGYHRDPGNFAYSPFEKEMRRRTWSLAMQLDLLISFQLGLPSNVQYPTWDTLTPTNLVDADFDEDTKVLPPSRPDTEITDILFYNAKHKLMAVFEKVLRHALNPAVDKASELNLLTSELEYTYFALPPILHPRSLSDSIVDPPSLIVCRLCVYFIYAKSRCVLHRPYAARGHPQSVRICYDAASTLARYFLNAYAEFQPGGQNASERWFLGSISWNDFLLASMVLCLVLCVSSKTDFGWHPDVADITALLEEAHSACKAQQVRGKDTQRVTKVIEAILMRFKQPECASESHIHMPTLPELETAGPTTASDPQSLDTGSVSGSSNPDSLLPWYDFGFYGPEYDEHMHSIEDISWKYIEEFLQLPTDDSTAL